MSILSLASYKSTWKGYEYYKENKVVSYKKLSNSTFGGTVNGTEKYDVLIDIEHPKNSKCNCAFAKDRRVICKHMVCLYFKIFPEEATKYYAEILKAEEEQEIYEQELLNRVENYVMHMSKKDLQSELINLLTDEWSGYAYDKFIEDHELY